jgi:hypothetical protein
VDGNYRDDSKLERKVGSDMKDEEKRKASHDDITRLSKELSDAKERESAAERLIQSLKEQLADRLSMTALVSAAANMTSPSSSLAGTSLSMAVSNALALTSSGGATGVVQNANIIQPTSNNNNNSSNTVANAATPSTNATTPVPHSSSAVGAESKSRSHRSGSSSSRRRGGASGNDSNKRSSRRKEKDAAVLAALNVSRTTLRSVAITPDATSRVQSALDDARHLEPLDNNNNNNNHSTDRRLQSMINNNLTLMATLLQESSQLRAIGNVIENERDTLIHRLASVVAADNATPVTTTIVPPAAGTSNNSNNNTETKTMSNVMGSPRIGATPTTITSPTLRSTTNNNNATNSGTGTVLAMMAAGSTSPPTPTRNTVTDTGEYTKLVAKYNEIERQLKEATSSGDARVQTEQVSLPYPLPSFPFVLF